MSTLSMVGGIGVIVETAVGANATAEVGVGGGGGGFGVDWGC